MTVNENEIISASDPFPSSNILQPLKVGDTR
jgi:hypothetical protein